MTTQEIAAGLLELFGPDGEHWTKCASARRADGYTTAVDSGEACCWCVNGAWAKITGIANGALLSVPSWQSFSRAVHHHNGDVGVAVWNDAQTTDWPDVKRVLEAVAAS
jgi:hypothetical protein